MSIILCICQGVLWEARGPYISITQFSYCKSEKGKKPFLKDIYAPLFPKLRCLFLSCDFVPSKDQVHLPRQTLHIPLTSAHPIPSPTPKIRKRRFVSLPQPRREIGGRVGWGRGVPKRRAYTPGLPQRSNSIKILCFGLWTHDKLFVKIN